MRGLRVIVVLVCALLIASCNTAKFVPKGQYLLNKTHIVVNDTHDVQPNDLKGYLKQTNNTEILGFWKLQLNIYNTAPIDTTKKISRWWARTAKKMGEAPEVYSPQLAEASRLELIKAMQGKGYFLCEVDTDVVYKKRNRVEVTYRIDAGPAYHLRNHSYDLPESEEMSDIAGDERRTLLHTGDNFDVTAMDNERGRIVGGMRRKGYYNMHKDVLGFTADSTVGGRQVDVEMHLAKQVEEMSERNKKRLFTQYTVRHVCFHTDYDPEFAPDSTLLNRTEGSGYEYTWVGKPLMRPGALRYNCKIRPGELYNERHVEQTYEMMNQLGIARYVDISFDEVGADSLDCHIVMSRGKLNSVSAEMEGTYSNGDWGIAAGVGYINRNLFRGAEELQLGVNGSYEWRANGGRAIEAKANASLGFSNRLKIATSYQYQTRPDEFTRTIVNGSLGYRLPQRTQGWNHSFNFLDISYVYLPWVSEEFQKRFINNQNPLKYSYQDHFIEAINYSCRYSGYNRLRPDRSYSAFYGFAEAAGNVLHGASLLLMPKPEDGVYKIGNVAFAQYVKLDLNYTYNQIIDSKNKIVYHAAAGVAYPYGNSQAIPYEKRYFGGGSNHVRGWLARTLGPGAYHGDGSRIDYDNQAGDIHLDLSMEYRFNVWNFIEMAAFTDAGNIWTIREYDSQPHGAFKWNEFYKQIAWSWGLGVRFDLSFLLFRVDVGFKIYDPTLIYVDGTQWRWADALDLDDDITVHFAIGYPF